MSRPTQVERVAAIETEIVFMRGEIRELTQKVDDLLALRNKGAGVFWMASIIFGTSIAGLLTTILHYIKS